MPEVRSGHSRTEVQRAPVPPSDGSPRSGSRASTSKSKALVPQPDKTVLPELKSSENEVDKKRPLPTSLQSDFIPEDVLFALTQPPTAAEQLGPSNRNRNLATSNSISRKPPASVWNHPKRREKFKHLTENTPCLCGAGRDISFLYDVPKEKGKDDKPDERDKSAIRGQEVEERKPILALPDTLIPDEYHVVKNKGVMGLEYHEDQYATQIADHKKHLVVFPSMAPTSRFEVLQLKKTLNEMLDRLGVADEEKELTGPTQIHNLLELIKKEQNIYNIIFHELIRQTSIECVERGELLGELRNKYSNLLNRVPRQVKSLHEEVLAQRALDRRLTEELMRFKSTIGILTDELSSVKEHDRQVTQQAIQAQEDLKTALLESHKNAGLLSEYHDLYELQRGRLEKQVSMLAEEKEIWSTAAYSLALKVTAEHSLNTAKRLHVSEKGWVKLANHFTILLSDKDTETLTMLQSYVDKFRDFIDEFNINIRVREDEIKKAITSVKDGVEKWIKDFQKNNMSKEGHFLRPLEQEKMMQLYKDLKSFGEMLSLESEKFTGDTLLGGQEALGQIRKMMDGWTDSALRVFTRHRQEDGSNYPDQEEMMRMNEEVEELLVQYHVRLTGENGVATGLIHTANGMETWDQKMNTVLHGSNPLPEQEWMRFYQYMFEEFHEVMEDWVEVLEETVGYVGFTQKEEDRQEKRQHRQVDLNEVMRITQKWLSSATNGIDSEDAKLVEQVSTLHTEMVKWMVQILLRLAPNKEEHSQEAKEAALLGSASVGELLSSAKSLFQRLEFFSKYVTQFLEEVELEDRCCGGTVLQMMQEKKDRHEEDADHEYKELQRLQHECDEWIRTAKLLISELTGEPYPEPKPAAPKPVTPSTPLTKVPEEGSTAGEGEAQPQEGDSQKQAAPSEGGEEAATQTKDEGEAAEPQADKQDEDEAGEDTQDVGDKDDAAEADDDGGAEAEVSLPATPQTQQQPQEPEAQEAAPEEPAKPAVDRIEIIGYDANTHTATLEHAPGAPPRDHTGRPASKERADTPNTKKAYEALSALEGLQWQLVATEERAQTAEERALEAENKLKEAMERIAALERRVGPSPPPEEQAQDKQEEKPPQEEPTKEEQQPPAADAKPSEKAAAKDGEKEKASKGKKKASGKKK